jgi:hypothetical protein
LPIHFTTTWPSWVNVRWWDRKRKESGTTGNVGEQNEKERKGNETRRTDHGGKKYARGTPTWSILLSEGYKVAQRHWILATTEKGKKGTEKGMKRERKGKTRARKAGGKKNTHEASHVEHIVIGGIQSRTTRHGILATTEKGTKRERKGNEKGTKRERKGNDKGRQEHGRREDKKIHTRHPTWSILLSEGSKVAQHGTGYLPPSGV